VPVNELGTVVDPEKDVVSFQGRTLSLELPALYRFYKPEFVLSTLGTDEHLGRKTITDFLGGIKERVYNVGRLDYDVSGIMVLTNDGELANKLLHPRYGNEREYVAQVAAKPTAATLKKLTEGIELEDGHANAKSAVVFPLSDCKDLFPGTTNLEEGFGLRLVVVEGRNHFVKRLLAEVGHPVERLARIRFGEYDLRGLKPGQIQKLT
jgi:pseudouridine synthase